MKFSVPDMSCGHCRGAIETALKADDPGSDVTFDQDHREIEVTTDLDAQNVLQILAQAGYPAVAI